MVSGGPPGPIWAPGHLKCQSKTVLELPFWGAPQNQASHFGPHVWTPFLDPIFGPHFWDPILGSHFGYHFWTPIFGLIFGPHFWTPFLDPHFWIPFWTPFLDPILENDEKWPPEGPRADLGPRPSKVSKQNCLGATILGSPPKSGTLILDPILDPIFGPRFLTPC